MHVVAYSETLELFETIINNDKPLTRDLATQP